jgi:hypothetical protein
MKNLLNKLFIVIFFLSIGKLTYSQKIDSVVYRHLRYYGKGIVPLKREIILYNDSTFQLTREFVNGTLYTSGYYSYCKEGVILNSFDFYKDTIVVIESKYENQNNSFYSFEPDKIYLLEIDNNHNILNDTIFLYYYDQEGSYWSIRKETPIKKNIIGFKIYKNDTFYVDYYLKNLTSNTFSFGMTPTFDYNTFYIKNKKCNIENDTLFFILYDVEKYYLVK